MNLTCLWRLQSLLFVMMSNLQDQIKFYLNSIKEDNNVENNLLDLKVALSSLSIGQLSEISRNFQLNTLFDCLNSSNNKQIIAACEVLKIILPTLPVSHLISQNGSLLIRALGHPMSEVKIVILNELIRAVGNDSMMLAIEQDTAWLTSVGRCLCHVDVSVGKRAVDFFIKLGQTKNGLVSLCQPVVIKELIENIGNNNVYVLRIFEVLVEVSATSGDALKYLENEGLLDRISTFLRTDDVLAMLSLVEVCTKMAVTTHGWDFLYRHGITKHLVEQFVSYEDNPLSNLTFPGLSKFFGQVSQKNPAILLDYPEILRCVFSAVDSDNLNIFIPALEIIGAIAYTTDGKIILQKQDERLMRHVMGRLYEAMTKLPTEWRVRALHTVANIVHMENTSPRAGEMMRLSEAWFNQLGTRGLTTVHEMAQQPFPELKMGALTIFLNIASQKWGQNKIYGSPNLLEFLLNRRTEHDAQGLQMKYDILRTFVEARANELPFEPPEYEAIAEYVRQGPFYAPSTTEVAIEGAE